MELGSCQKVLRYLKQEGILLPRHQTSGERKMSLAIQRKPDDKIVDPPENFSEWERKRLVNRGLK